MVTFDSFLHLVTIAKISLGSNALIYNGEVFLYLLETRAKILRLCGHLPTKVYLCDFLL